MFGPTHIGFLYLYASVLTFRCHLKLSKFRITVINGRSVCHLHSFLSPPCIHTTKLSNTAEHATATISSLKKNRSLYL